MLLFSGVRSTEEQIIRVLQEARAGEKPKDVCRRHGICEQTLDRWKAKYGGMKVSDARKLRHLEDENRKLKQLLAEVTLDNQSLKELLLINVNYSCRPYCLTEECNPT